MILYLKHPNKWMPPVRAFIYSVNYYDYFPPNNCRKKEMMLFITCWIDVGFGFTGAVVCVGVDDIIMVAVGTGVEVWVGVAEEEGTGTVTVGAEVSDAVGAATGK